MATRSTIAIEHEDGTIQQVYCHWDGYLSNNGRILMEHYQDPAKVQRLIDHGSISSLKPEIGEKHDFDWYFKKESIPQDMKDIYENLWTLFYHRDRGEELVISQYKDFSDYEVNAQFEEYDYILRKGVWYVQEHGGRWKNLAKAIEAEEVLEDM